MKGCFVQSLPLNVSPHTIHWSQNAKPFANLLILLLHIHSSLLRHCVTGTKIVLSVVSLLAELREHINVSPWLLGEAPHVFHSICSNPRWKVTVTDKNMWERRPLQNADLTVELSWIRGRDELFLYPLYNLHAVCCKAWDVTLPL